MRRLGPRCDPGAGGATVARRGRGKADHRGRGAGRERARQPGRRCPAHAPIHEPDRKSHTALSVRACQGAAPYAGVHFTHFTGRTVLHCHILNHEDMGMMAVLDIAPRPPPEDARQVTADARRHTSLGRRTGKPPSSCRRHDAGPPRPGSRHRYVTAPGEPVRVAWKGSRRRARASWALRRPNRSAAVSDDSAPLKRATASRAPCPAGRPPEGRPAGPGPPWPPGPPAARSAG
ncbi:multicopper oxidase domain-containing protein [Streptomyces sp. NPDC058439]|uniref:multicopper oxidase domain-containing protein n=1 Tax=Streptomyces sp. NPDC058439 TaxID=3346500 RepID=UPI0036567D4F